MANLDTVSEIISVIGWSNESVWTGRSVNKSKKLPPLKLGSSIHQHINSFISKSNYNAVEPKIKKAMANFELWAKENVKKWVASELMCYHDELGYYGVIDAVAILKNNKLAILEFKTTYPKDVSELQITAYSICNRTQDYKVDLSKVKELYIVFLHPATLEWHSHLVDKKETQPIFMFTYNIWKWRKQRLKK